MPRSKNNVKLPKPCKETVKLAVNSILEERLSIRKASTEYGISRSLIARSVKRHKESGKREFEYKVNYDVKRVFTDSEENGLIDYCLKASKFNYDLSRQDFLKLAYQYAVSLNKEFPDSWIRDQAAGKTFYFYFRQRHPNLSFRKLMGKMPSNGFDKTLIIKFFKKYKEVLEKYEFTPDKIYNVDESNLCTVHTKIKNDVNESPSEWDDHVTLIGCVNALGNSIPPCLIFPRLNYKTDMINGAPFGTLGLSSLGGLTSSEIFETFLKHFIEHVKPGNNNRVLLLMDNHESHISLNIIELAQSNGITLLTFPPHTNHMLQPLERGVFVPLKHGCNKACSQWSFENPGKCISLQDIAVCFGKAYPDAFSLLNIRNGFMISGIWPLNENIIEQLVFLTSYISSQPNLFNDNAKTGCSESVDQDCSQNQESSSSDHSVESACPKRTTPEIVKTYSKSSEGQNNLKSKPKTLTDTSKRLTSERQSNENVVNISENNSSMEEDIIIIRVESEDSGDANFKENSIEVVNMDDVA